MTGTIQMPVSYPPRPYQPKLPQLMQSLMMNYMQQKYATDRQKKEWDRRDKEAGEQRTFEREKITAEARLGKLKYFADMRKDHIRLSGPEITPELEKKGYEQGDVIAGLNSDNWWVKRREKKPVTFHKITDKGVIETKATYTGEIQRLKDEGWKRGDVTLRDKETWGEPKLNKQLNAVTIKSSLGNMKVFGKKGWKPATEEQYMAGKKAGAMRVQITGEKFEVEKGRTVAAMRGTLTKSKSDKAVFGSEAPQFNKMNKQNEVAYWGDSKYFGKETKIMKLSKSAIDAGWTPTEVQEKASISGMTVEQILKEIGEL